MHARKRIEVLGAALESRILTACSHGKCRRHLKTTVTSSNRAISVNLISCMASSVLRSTARVFFLSATFDTGTWHCAAQPEDVWPCQLQDLLGRLGLAKQIVCGHVQVTHSMYWVS